MLAYDQPIKPDDRLASPRTQAGFSVFELVGLLWQRRVAIAMAALIGACAAVAIGKSLTPKYTATAAQAPISAAIAIATLRRHSRRASSSALKPACVRGRAGRSSGFAGFIGWS